MGSIRRILVPIKDNAAKTTPALEKAAQLAHGLGARIELFHGITTPLYLDGYTQGKNPGQLPAAHDPGRDRPGPHFFQARET